MLFRVSTFVVTGVTFVVGDVVKFNMPLLAGDIVFMEVVLIGAGVVVARIDG